ncbi:hypothetical protein [Candidatus Palauibacter sp.]|uniref:hypothetical protein n=1 Tax=Candidatus Palauibacter sp. TaxID=3101350 RepID=UPI003B596673
MGCYTRMMLPEIQRSRVLPLAILALTALSAPCEAQFRDARLPESGQLWFEMVPTLLNWTEQFALNSSVDSIADGDREPLAAHFDGPLALRIFPPPVALLDGLNADAGALGFDPVAPDDFSFGDLEFSTMRAQIRQLALGAEVGVLDWVSVGFRAPFTLADMTTTFAFDSTAATVTGNVSGFAPADPFIVDSRAALGSLGAMITSGTLSGPTLTEAIALRDNTRAFLNALERRAGAGALIPTAPSAAGSQMLSRFAGFAAAFEALGLALPELALPEFASDADFEELFLAAGLGDRLPKNSRNGLALGELEVFVRVNLIDQITRRRPIPGSAGAEEPPSSPDPERGIRFRTTVGGLLRVPIRSQNAPPFRDLTNSADVPIGDGQTDIEIALYQDIAFGSRLMIQVAGHYGIQRSDAFVAHIALPDRPYTTGSLQTLLFRDLGDYISLLVRPSLRLNPAMSLGLEYDYFQLGDPVYALTDSAFEEWDPGVVGAEGSQKRHRLGVGFTVDLSEAQSRDELRSATRPVRRPWRFGISLRRAIAGSGGRTPASFRFGADFRVPINIF